MCKNSISIFHFRVLAIHIDTCSDHSDNNAWITRMKGQQCVKIAQGRVQGYGMTSMTKKKRFNGTTIK